ncbi:MAG: beta-aspartyl-peptidase, partial [Solobacterium sp.]|nr:beta-aspartyl-peptidase [Solobacterium sp.]
MIILKNADVYAPEHLGKRDILIAGNRIEKIAEHLDGYENIAEAEVIDLQGRKTVPGYIDMHEHITGGGGEKGFASRVPEAQAGILLGNGITTVLGMLGTDGVTRSLENLVAKAYAFREEGIRAYTLTGFYGYPTPTLMENVERDVMMIDTMIGVKTSMSDHR